MQKRRREDIGKSQEEYHTFVSFMQKNAHTRKRSCKVFLRYLLTVCVPNENRLVCFVLLQVWNETQNGACHSFNFSHFENNKPHRCVADSVVVCCVLHCKVTSKIKFSIAHERLKNHREPRGRSAPPQTVLFCPSRRRREAPVWPWFAAVSNQHELWCAESLQEFFPDQQLDTQRTWPFQANFPDDVLV